MPASLRREGALMATGEQDRTDIDTALGVLINLSGKMRMLSHRVAMFALLSASKPDMAVTACAALDRALAEFNDINLALQQGDDRLAVPAHAVAYLSRTGAIGAEAIATIEEFLERVTRLRRFPLHGAATDNSLVELVEFVASDLLAALNSVTEGIGCTLGARFEERDRRVAEARMAMLGAVGSISEVSMKVKLISLNASIEAARAGVHGKSFGVIASEIRSLSEDAARSAQGLRQQMQLQGDR